MASPKYHVGFLLSNIYFRQAAEKSPARIVATVHASLVYSPPPHKVENQRSTPPITLVNGVTVHQNEDKSLDVSFEMNGDFADSTLIVLEQMFEPSN